MFESFKWGLAGLSLFGVLLNIRRRRECFAVWMVGNICWAGVDAYHGIYSQAALQALYAGLSVYGWLEWRNQDAP